MMFAEAMEIWAESLRTAAENRREEDIQVRLSKDVATALADRSHTLINQLGDLFVDTAVAVPDMSTRFGLVDNLSGDRYVDEEIHRLQRLRMLDKWQSEYTNHRADIFDRSQRDERFLGGKRTEDHTFAQVRAALVGPIPNLPLEDECKRNALALQDATRQRKGIRNRVLRSIADTPAQIGYLFAAGGAFIHAAAAGVVAGGTAVAQGGSVYLWNRNRRNDLIRVEKDMLDRLRLRHLQEPKCVEHAIANVGFDKSPKQVLDVT